MFRIYSTSQYAISPTSRKLMLWWVAFVLVSYLFLFMLYYNPVYILGWWIADAIVGYHVLWCIIPVILGWAQQGIMKKDMETPWIGEEEAK